MGFRISEEGKTERLSLVTISAIPHRNKQIDLGVYPVIWANRIKENVIMCYRRPEGSLHLSRTYFNESQLEEISKQAEQGELKKIRIESIDEEQYLSGASKVVYLTDEQEKFLIELARDHQMFYGGAGMDGS